MIYVNEEQCTGCGLCVEACPTGAMRLVGGVAQVEQSLCRECEVCLSTCPNGAILALQEPVRAPGPIPTPTRPVAPAPRSNTGVWPWLGAALGFVGRELVPWVAALLRNRGQRSRPVASPYRAASIPGRGNYPRRGGGRRARHRRRGRW